MTEKFKIGKSSKEDYKKFLRKSDEFYEMMQHGLLTFHFGLRSISPKHDDAVKLLISMMKRDDTENKAKHLRRLISVKNLVEYDGRLLSRNEAESLSMLKGFWFGLNLSCHNYPLKPLILIDSACGS